MDIPMVTFMHDSFRGIIKRQKLRTEIQDFHLSLGARKVDTIVVPSHSEIKDL
jgi:hypothetical protein